MAMTDLFVDDERDASNSDSKSKSKSKSQSRSPHKPMVYDSIQDEEASLHNSSIGEDSRLELPRPGYSHPHQHRIIPPSITGHGRLIFAHRTVPYFAGVLFVIGSFAWAVWCAIFVYPILQGHPRDWKPSHAVQAA